MIREVKVCDAIMSSGKSESAITYINEHPDRKFIYITPYLDEAKRIKSGCPGMHFAEPVKVPEHKRSKVVHTKDLIAQGRNIATTHSAFKCYTSDMIKNIQAQRHILLVDEAVDVFCEAEYRDGDIKVFEDSGHIAKNDDGDMFTYTGKEYDGELMSELFKMLRCNNLIPVDAPKGGRSYYYWAIPSEIMKAFDEVIVMTYQFESSEFKYFLDINDIPYRYIGIHYDGVQYRFADSPEYIPDYIRHLKEKIHVFAGLDDIGNNRWDLSARWFTTHEADRKKLKNNVYNYFRNYRKAKRNEILWSTYKDAVYYIKGRGFGDQNIEFNRRATNEYADKTVLAYCVNIFPSPQKIRFFAKYGIDYDADGYALSVMIQWIWRSAIRVGEDIDIYVPSKRMRTLLLEWIDEVSELAELQTTEDEADCLEKACK